MTEQLITSRKNATLVHVKKLLTSKSYRSTCGEFVAEGTKLLAEAAKWYGQLKTVIATENLPLCPLPEQVQVIRVPEDVMQSISQMDAPQGAIFVCDLPQIEEIGSLSGSIILDGIQDPGNMGTILRTADSLDVRVILSQGCVDPYNPKSVRASMGSIFRSQPYITTCETIIEQARQQGTAIVSTALSPSAVDIRNCPLTHCCVVIGSEGNGVSTKMLEQSETMVMIPMSPRCESLNAAVAATIVMWQMKR